MKKLVFLHGAGSDKNAYSEFMHKVARHFNADIISFDAPYKHPEKPDKYVWFHKFKNDGRRDAVLEEYKYSLKYIKEQLSYLNTEPKDIILIGHSQGGGMAVHVGLEMDIGGVISINGDLPYNISYSKKTDTPVYWLESGQDTYIDDNRKKSYRLILNNENFHLLKLDNSTHNEFQDDFWEIINNGIIKF